jgi:hypothetical protein
MKNLKIELSQAFTLLLVVLLLGVSVWAGILYRQKNQIASEQKINPATFDKPNEPIAKFTTPDGVRHNTYKVQKTTKESIKNGSSISPAYVDSLAKALQISNTEIKEIAVIKASLEGEVKANHILIDSLKRRTWFFKQKYMIAQFSEADSILKYKYKPTFGYARTAVKSGFLKLGPIKEQIDIFSADTNMIIDKVNQLSIKDRVRRKPFGLGLQIGYFWNPLSGKVEKSIGVGLNYSIVRF